MSKVICYTKLHLPENYDENSWYFELFSKPLESQDNVGYVGNGLLRELRRSKITPSSEALDFVIIAMSVVSADKAILRRNSPDGWTRQINLEIPLQKAEEWEKVKDKLEKMLRFLSGDFWKLTFTQLPESIALDNFTEDRDKDCVCLLSGGMDSLVGGIDLCEYGKTIICCSNSARRRSSSKGVCKYIGQGQPLSMELLYKQTWGIGEHHSCAVDCILRICSFSFIWSFSE
ncbi:MAG: hypothetical protein ACLRYB_18545 [Segatella copri]